MGKVCAGCGKSRTEAKFYYPYSKWCGPCEYEHYRLIRLQYKYGITPDEYLKLHADQAGCCAICGIHESKTIKRLHVDHCHDTGRVRGLLCAKCNTSIGQFEREPERLLRAYDYIVGG